MQSPELPASDSAADSPAEPGLQRLRDMIAAVAAGDLPVDVILTEFRALHEAIERRGRPAYRSRAEARILWDVLWMLEFYSPDPAQEANPREWHGADAVLAEVRRAAERLGQIE